MLFFNQIRFSRNFFDSFDFKVKVGDYKKILSIILAQITEKMVTQGRVTLLLHTFSWSLGGCARYKMDI